MAIQGNKLADLAKSITAHRSTTNGSIPAATCNCDPTVVYRELFYLAGDLPTTDSDWILSNCAGNVSPCNGHALDVTLNPSCPNSGIGILA